MLAWSEPLCFDWFSALQHVVCVCVCGVCLNKQIRPCCFWLIDIRRSKSGGGGLPTPTLLSVAKNTHVWQEILRCFASRPEEFTSPSVRASFVPSSCSRNVSFTSFTLQLSSLNKALGYFKRTPLGLRSSLQEISKQKLRLNSPPIKSSNEEHPEDDLITIRESCVTCTVGAF